MERSFRLRREMYGGFAVLIFDYRYLGSSQGEPRQLIDSRRHCPPRAVDFAWATHGIDATGSRYGYRSAEATLSTLPADDPEYPPRSSPTSGARLVQGNPRMFRSPVGFRPTSTQVAAARILVAGRGGAWTLRAAQSDRRRTRSPCTGRSITVVFSDLALAERFREVEENAPTWRNQVTSTVLVDHSALPQRHDRADRCPVDGHGRP